jgi:hypothetical protein
VNQTIGHRLLATAALVVAVATVLFAIDVTLSRIPKGFTVVACVVLAVVVAGYGLVRRGTARVVALAVAVLLLAGSILLVLVEHDPTDDVLVAAGAVIVLAAARRAFRVRFEWPTARPPERPVLFFNPLSGGGKAERFDLAGEARRRGIEPIELRRGDDLERLVRDAVSRGADALAMAGGDGSQAVVAMVAAELDLPYACIPSGTRNHFALDLGVDRNDVVEVVRVSHQVAAGLGEAVGEPGQRVNPFGHGNAGDEHQGDQAERGEDGAGEQVAGGQLLVAEQSWRPHEVADEQPDP